METMSCPIVDPEEYKSVHSERTLKDLMAMIEKRNLALRAMSKTVKELPQDGSFNRTDYGKILRVVEMRRTVDDITGKLHVE